MARKFANLLERFSRQQSRKDRELFPATIIKKQGVGKADIAFKTCQDATCPANEPTPFNCGASVTVAVEKLTGSCTVLPGRQASPGRAVTVPARVFNTPPPTTPAEFIIFYYDSLNTEVTSSLHAADGTFITDFFTIQDMNSAGRSFYPSTASGLAEGSRISQEQGEVRVTDFQNNNVLAHVPLAGRKPSTPMAVGDFLYWFEYDEDVGDPLTVRLFRSTHALGSITEVNSDSFSKSVTKWFPLDTKARLVGTDWTTTHGGIWLSYNTDGGEPGAEELWRVWMPYAGGGGSIATISRTFSVADKEPRAGYPNGTGKTLTLDYGFGVVDLEVDESEDRTVQQYDSGSHAPNTLYTTWSTSPTACDIAFGPDDGRVYLLQKGPPAKILVYTTAGAFVEELPITPQETEVVGLHKLASPIEA